MTKAEMEQEIAKFKGLAESLSKKSNEMEAIAQTKVKEIELNAMGAVVLEEINRNVMTGVKYSVINALTSSYNSPILPMVAKVVMSREEEIKTAINEAFDFVLKKGDLVDALKSELSKKLARELINTVSGSIEKGITLCKQDPLFKSKVIVKINEILDSEHGGK
jgi:hypothetical protein